MNFRLPPAPQNKVVVESEICPSLSFHRRRLQVQKSGSSVSALANTLRWGSLRSGRMGTPVSGMRRLNHAATAYTAINAAIDPRWAQLKAREDDLKARRRERERKARTKRLIEVGAMAESAAGFEGGDERAKEHIARLVQLGSLVEAMCSTDVMDNYTSREDLKTTVTKALEHNVRTSDGMNWNLHDLVYEALSEEWGRRDGEISDLWADDGPSGYQPPSYEPVNPERRTPQTPSDGLI